MSVVSFGGDIQAIAWMHWHWVFNIRASGDTNVYSPAYRTKAWHLEHYKGVSKWSSRNRNNPIGEWRKDEYTFHPRALLGGWGYYRGDAGWIPSTYTAHSPVELQFQGVWRPLLDSTCTRHEWYPHIHSGKPLAHINFFLKEKRKEGRKEGKEQKREKKPKALFDVK